MILNVDVFFWLVRSTGGMSDKPSRWLGLLYVADANIQCIGSQVALWCRRLVQSQVSGIHPATQKTILLVNYTNPLISQ